MRPVLFLVLSAGLAFAQQQPAPATNPQTPASTTPANAAPPRPTRGQRSETTAPATTTPQSGTAAKPPAASTGRASRATLAEAEKFMQETEQELLGLTIKASRASWIQENFITDDTEVIASQANDDLIAATTKRAEAARRFDSLQMPPELARKFKLLKLALTLPAPSDPKLREELSTIATWLDSAYGKGKYCPKPGSGSVLASKVNPETGCLSMNDLEKVLADSRDPAELKEAWLGWHAIAPPMKTRYARFVELANQGAREMGFADVGAMWRSNYDMPPDQFAAEMERLWKQVEPLYLQLHAYVRTRLREKYGPEMVPADGPIPAQLLGNMWSQDWSNIYPLVKPANSDPGYDLSGNLKKQGYDAKKMVRTGESFFKSLGYQSLPDTFWERSLFTRPRDRDVVCHASAWDIDTQDDVRLKVCLQPTAEDFATVHHELGHDYYYLAYKTQPFFFQNSANDGFHEAIGDTIALSITPDYLKKIGLIDQIPAESADTGLLLYKALEKIAFLPFGYLVDQWRWEVFSGKVKPQDYNKAWWELRTKYQGISPPEPRTEADFDPAAKYHVASNTPYARYFLALILQFQFHRALCKIEGYQGPLHRCSIYGNKEAGARLHKMLEMGQSKPWPDALKELTGQDKMDATAVIDYFAPLMKWLQEQNKGTKVGW